MSIKRGLKAIREDQGFDLWLLKSAVERAILGDMNEPKDKKKKSFAPSTIGYGHGRCPRYWYYAFNGATYINTNSSESTANMEAGRDRHERFAEYFGKAPGVKIIEVEKNIEVDIPPVYAFIDIIIEFNGVRAVGEFKTTGSRSWYATLKKREPKDYHLIQVLLYMYFENIKQGFVMYENKDTNELLFLEVKYDDYKEQIEGVIEWMKLLRETWEESPQALPLRSGNSNKSKICKYCPVKDACWKDEEGEIEFDTLEF